MTENPDEERVGQRADLLPEERGAGSDNAVGQAEVILADSDERTADPERARHDSSQTPDR
jgi:hypothetical protein